ncbi:MAG: SRPBCC domain-containing protein [Thermoactinospora sp.]|nr:SRPBCC domain-containing protein [Thermoactinospora sp.]
MSDVARISRRIAAPPSEVFADWVSKSRLESWLWPEPLVQINPVAGGYFHFKDTMYGIAAEGMFEEVVPAKRLAFTWRWIEDESTSAVVVSFDDNGDGSTTVTVAHAGAPHERQPHEEGWASCLDRLEARHR